MDAAPTKSHRELFEFQTIAASTGSGELFAEHPVAKPARKRRKRCVFFICSGEI